jgi:hypothetical protein
MTAEMFKIEPVAEETEQSTADRTGFELLRVGLKALSQRALIALSTLFTLLTVGSAFWLFMSIHEPNTMQLIEIGMYAAFVLAINLIVKRG